MHTIFWLAKPIDRGILGLRSAKCSFVASLTTRFKLTERHVGVDNDRVFSWSPTFKYRKQDCLS
jgi:hypothetical protein